MVLKMSLEEKKAEEEKIMEDLTNEDQMCEEAPDTTQTDIYEIIDMRIQNLSVPPQELITKDSVTVYVNAIM